MSSSTAGAVAAAAPSTAAVALPTDDERRKGPFALDADLPLDEMMDFLTYSYDKANPYVGTVCILVFLQHITHSVIQVKFVWSFFLAPFLLSQLYNISLIQPIVLF